MYDSKLSVYGKISRRRIDIQLDIYTLCVGCITIIISKHHRGNFCIFHGLHEEFHTVYADNNHQMAHSNHNYGDLVALQHSNILYISDGTACILENGFLER